MRWLLVAACTLCVGLLSGPACAESLLIAADRVYPAPDAAPLSNGTILVADGRITSVADERSRIAIPDGTKTSACRGVVVAGFQNSHVHLLGPLFDGAATQPAPDLERGVESMLTRYGFTTVFDTGSDLANTVAIRSRIEKGDMAAKDKRLQRLLAVTSESHCARAT